MNKLKIEVNDIVQIIDEQHPWFPCLLIVGEVKSWGVQAGAMVPNSNVKNNVGVAWNRLKFEQIEKVGTAVISDREAQL